MSPRESVKEKALRYIGDERLEIEYVGQGRVVANCRGDGGSYSIAYDPRRRKWSCSCPSRRRCCHIEGAALVTATPEALN
jgi:hypothetical protein